LPIRKQAFNFTPVICGVDNFDDAWQDQHRLIPLTKNNKERAFILRPNKHLIDVQVEQLLVPAACLPCIYTMQGEARTG
jgi:hypothetical protein